MRKFLFLLALIATISISMPVKGNDVGFINYSSSSTLNYNLSKITAPGNLNAPFSKFILDTGNYTSINTATVYTYDMISWPKASDYTTFTFTSGATGSGGYVSYVNTASSGGGGIVTYVFNPDMVVTSSQEVVLNLATDIFSGVTVNTTKYAAGGVVLGLIATYPLNLTNPFTITCNVGGCGQTYVGLSTAVDAIPEQYFTYDIEALANVSVRYNASYFSIGSDPHFNVSITKPGSTQTIPTIVRIQNQTIHTYAEDSALSSTSSFNAFGTYSTGLYANITDSHGDSDTFIINSTGITSPTPTPTPVLNPSTNAGIVWNKNNYSVNEIGIITWLIDSSILNFIYNFNIRIFDNVGEVQRFDNMDVSALTGTVQYKFLKVGGYEAEFHKDLCTILGCIEQILDNKSVTVSLNPSYIYINSPVLVGTNFTASYIFGNTVLLQGALNSVTIRKFTDDGGLAVGITTSLDNYNIQPGTSYNVTIPGVDSAGKYKAELFDLSRGVIASTIFDAVEGFIQPTQNITASYIITDKDYYLYDDTIIIDYGIDNSNFSNGSLSKYLAIYNYNNNVYNKLDIWGIANPIYPQTDIINFRINDPASAGRNILSGTNQIRIMARNNSSNIILAFKNVTISKVDSSGYGLQIAKKTLCINENTNINAYSPSTGTVIIWKSNSYGGRTLVKAYNFTANKTIGFGSPTSGNYPIELLNSTGDTYKEDYINVKSSCDALTPSVSPTTTASTTSVIGSNISNLLQSTVFWALILIVGVMLMISRQERKK